MYIVRSDETGAVFAEALAVRARAGVRVRVLYDWLGAVGKTSRRLWRELRAAGVEVRASNPPAWDSPLGWLGRDHRKMLAVDGRVAYVSGLCIGAEWSGDPARGIEPWRDMGVEVQGPAVGDIERAFAEMWAASGEPLPPAERPSGEQLAPAGSIGLRVVATTPNLAGLYRLDLLVAALARRRLWLTDAYFAGVSAYVQALCAAASDGVDVRLLVPSGSDIPAIRVLSQIGYRPLLRSGVRVFEWNGAMLHAKSAVADTRWARIGSTNLNVGSWFANWELDIVIEDEGFAQAVETVYEKDLGRSTEVVLSRRSAARGASPGRGSRRRASRAAAGAIRIGNLVGATLVRRRVQPAIEKRVMIPAGLTLLLLGLGAIVWPFAVAVPFSVIVCWIGVALIARALRRGS
jgi:cardiolipin synthase